MAEDVVVGVRVQGEQASSPKAQWTQSRDWIGGLSQSSVLGMMVSRSQMRTQTWENIRVINKNREKMGLGQEFSFLTC